MASVSVIGAGVGGLAAAIRLAGAGHQVKVYEKNEVAGGKLASRTINGYKFDTGPSLLTLPRFLDELGVNVDLIELEHPFHYSFADGSSLETSSVDRETQAAFEAFSRGAGAQWLELMKRGGRAWLVAERTFFAAPISWSSLRLMNSPADLLAIDPFRTLHLRATRTFSDPRLQQWLDRYATYSGSSPFKAPATLTCIPFIEQAYKCWHVAGGLASIAVAMQGRAEQLGVEFHFDHEITSLDEFDTDIKVANVDASVLYKKLYPRPQQMELESRAPRSTAGFAMLLGLKGKTDGLRHHNVFFAADYKREFDEIENDGVATEPTVYVCCSSVTEAGDAPDGNENWFVLVNVRAGALTDWKAYGDKIIDRLGIRDRIEVREDLSPQFYEQRYNSPGGAIYGTSSDGKRAAFLRAGNRGAAKGLYLVGGSAHPGGGIPLVLSSARIVADAIAEDGWK